MKSNKILSLLAIGLILLAIANVVPVAAGNPVNAKLQPVITADTLVFKVSSDGEYLLLQEGNVASEQLKATAVGGEVKFVTKAGNKAFKLVGVEVTSLDPAWTSCTADGWFCYDASAVPTPTTVPVVKATTTSGEYDLNPIGQFLDCGMWHVRPTEKLMVWTGGSSWVHTCFNEAAKQLLLNGYTAEFTMSVPFVAHTCRSYWNGEDSNGNPMNLYVPGSCWKVPFRAGTYRVNGWAVDPQCGVQVGFRVVPNDAAPWTETRTCTNCGIWPFPNAPAPPSYRGAVPPVPAPATPDLMETLRDLLKQLSLLIERLDP